MYILSALIRAWRGRRAIMSTRQELRSLDDHLLRDIGIRRDQIDVYAEGRRSQAHLAAGF